MTATVSGFVHTFWINERLVPHFLPLAGISFDFVVGKVTIQVTFLFPCSCMDIWYFSIGSYDETNCYELSYSCTVFVEMFSYLLNKYLKVEFLGHVVYEHLALK